MTVNQLRIIRIRHILGDMRNAAPVAKTFEPQAEQEGLLLDLVAELRSRGKDVPSPSARLVSRAGRDIQLPDELYRLLVFAAENLAAGRAITLAPLESLLTTQEAAEFLGMSRPALIKRLDRGDLPCSMVGRHRRVRLGDLVTYQQAQAEVRRRALDEMAEIALEHDLYNATAEPAVGIR